MSTEKTTVTTAADVNMASTSVAPPSSGTDDTLEPESDESWIRKVGPTMS